MLDSLSSSLKDALKKIAGKTVVDRAAVEELVRSLQRALLQADVNVKLVMQLSQSIKKRALEEEPPKGMNVREHVLRIVYQELVGLMGGAGKVELVPPPAPEGFPALAATEPLPEPDLVMVRV